MGSLSISERINMKSIIHVILAVLFCKLALGDDNASNEIRIDNAPEEKEDTAPFITFEISTNVLYGIFVLVITLLLVNVACLCYFNCYHSSKKKNKYSKIEIIGSSDEDMEDLKEINV